jgi:hypothetical protein
MSFSIIAVLSFAIIAAVVSSLSSTQLALAQRVRDSREGSSSSTDGTEQDNGGDSSDIASSNDNRDSRDSGDNTDNGGVSESSSNIPDRNVCRTGDVTADNDRPDRFEVFSTCKEAIGTIAADQGKQGDGDQKYYLSPDSQYTYLTKGENGHNGQLILEVNPVDQDSPLIEHPKEGDRVRVLGAWVNDGNWQELHPVYLLQALNDGSTRDVSTTSSTDNTDNTDLPSSSRDISGGRDNGDNADNGE